MADKFVPVVVRLTPTILERIDFLREFDGQSRQAFIRSAVSRAVKNWKPPTTNQDAWGACPHCGKRHDPVAAHGLAI